MRRLTSLNQVCIPRCLSPGRKLSSFKLHIFTDASEEAFAAAVYPRTGYPDGGATTSLLMAKKLAAKKTSSLSSSSKPPFWDPGWQPMRKARWTTQFLPDSSGRITAAYGIGSDSPRHPTRRSSVIASVKFKRSLVQENGVMSHGISTVVIWRHDHVQPAELYPIPDSTVRHCWFYHHRSGQRIFRGRYRRTTYAEATVTRSTTFVAGQNPQLWFGKYFPSTQRISEASLNLPNPSWVRLRDVNSRLLVSCNRSVSTAALIRNRASRSSHRSWVRMSSSESKAESVPPIYPMTITLYHPASQTSSVGQDHSRNIVNTRYCSM